MSASACVSSCRNARMSRFADIVRSMAASSVSPSAEPASSRTERSMMAAGPKAVGSGVGTGSDSGSSRPRVAVMLEAAARVRPPLGRRPVRCLPAETPGAVPPPGPARSMLGARAPGPGPSAGSVEPGIGPRFGNSRIAVRWPPVPSCCARPGAGSRTQAAAQAKAVARRCQVCSPRMPAFLFEAAVPWLPGTAAPSAIIGKATATASSSRVGQVRGHHSPLV